MCCLCSMLVFIVLCVLLEMLLVWRGLYGGPGPHVLPMQLVWKVLKQSTKWLVFGKVL